MFHFLLSEFHLYFNSWNSASSLLSLRGPHAIPRWAVGWGSCGMHLTWSVVLPGPQGLGGCLLQRPCPYSSSAPACDVFILSICDTSHCTHTHTHTEPVLTGPPPLCPTLVVSDPVPSWTLPRRCPRAVCVGPSPRRVPQEAARPSRARWHSGDAPAAGALQSFAAFTPGAPRP